ncbi:MAG: hypothetical protein IPP34_20085 [Bacteroidetes bacterium]|nr:hypothetical protein [Bacteroidota bacterium]
MEFESNKLQEMLKELFIQEQKIKEYIKNTNQRFSFKKFTADLGEYYAKEYLLNNGELFKSIEQEASPISEHDLIGELSETSPLKKYFTNNTLRIEVKTRRGQKGKKYLGGVHPDKFDLLCVIDMNDDYSYNKHHLVDSATAMKCLDTKYKRLIFDENKHVMAF